MRILKGAGYILLAIVIISTMAFSVAFLTTVGVIVGFIFSGILLIGFTAFCLKTAFELKRRFF